MRILLLSVTLLLLVPYAPLAAAEPTDDPFVSLVPVCYGARDDLVNAVAPVPVVGGQAAETTRGTVGDACWRGAGLAEFAEFYYDWWLHPVSRDCVPADAPTPNLGYIPDEGGGRFCMVSIILCGSASSDYVGCTLDAWVCDPTPRCLDASPCEPWPACRAPDVPPLGIDSWPQTFGDDVDGASAGRSETLTVPGQTVPAVGVPGHEGVHESVFIPLAPGKDVNKPGWQGLPARDVPAERTCVVPQVCVNPVTVPGHPGWEQETLLSIPSIGGHDQPIDVGPVQPVPLVPATTVGPYVVPVGFGVGASGVSYVVVVGSETLPGGSVLGVVDYCPEGTCPSNADADADGTVTYGVQVGDVGASDAVTLP